MQNREEGYYWVKDSEGNWCVGYLEPTGFLYLVSNKHPHLQEIYPSEVGEIGSKIEHQTFKCPTCGSDSWLSE